MRPADTGRRLPPAVLNSFFMLSVPFPHNAVPAPKRQDMHHRMHGARRNMSARARTARSRLLIQQKSQKALHRRHRNDDARGQHLRHGRKLPTSSTSPHTITRNAALCRPFSGTEALKYGHANTGHDAAAHTMPTIPGTMPSTVRSAAARQKLRPRGSSFRFVASISIITPAATVAILNTRSARDAEQQHRAAQNIQRCRQNADAVKCLARDIHKYMLPFRRTATRPVRCENAGASFVQIISV